MRRILACFLALLPLLFTGSSVFAENSSQAQRRQEKRLALTFDDGPHPRYTPQILDILAEYDIKATFFVIGENAALYPDPLRRAASEGHEIGNHTYTHPEMHALSAADFRREIADCQAEIERVTGVRPRLFRPPTGFIQPPEEHIPTEFALSRIKWSIDTEDWSGNSADDIVGIVKREAGDGKIVLMHDYVSHKSKTVEALRRLIPYLLENGYSFCTVSEL